MYEKEEGKNVSIMIVGLMGVGHQWGLPVFSKLM